MEVSQLEILNNGYCQPYNAKTARALDLDIKIRKNSLELIKAKQRFRLNQLKDAGEIPHLDSCIKQVKNSRALSHEINDENQTTVEDFMQDIEDLTNDQSQLLRQSIQQQLNIEKQQKCNTNSFKIKMPKLKDIKPSKQYKTDEINDLQQFQNLSIFSHDLSSHAKQCFVNKQIDSLITNRNKLSLFRTELQRLRQQRQNDACPQTKSKIAKQKQKIISKFIEMSTMKEAQHPRAYSISDTVDSALITRNFVKTACIDSPNFQNDQQNFENYFNVAIQNQVVGPTRNLYQFSKTREQY